MPLWLCWYIRPPAFTLVLTGRWLWLCCHERPPAFTFDLIFMVLISLVFLDPVSFPSPLWLTDRSSKTAHEDQNIFAADLRGEPLAVRQPRKIRLGVRAIRLLGADGECAQFHG